MKKLRAFLLLAVIGFAVLSLFSLKNIGSDGSQRCFFRLQEKALQERVHAAQSAAQQDKNEPPLSAEASQVVPPVRFLSEENGLTELEMFSASWWQPIERFLEFPVHEIGSVEDDAFVPLNLAGRGISDGRMTRDWLDFSIEHLSKWWKLAGSAGKRYAEEKLDNYVKRSSRQGTIMNTTIAIIPYGVPDKKGGRTKRTWMMALAATIKSLLKQGIARIVVVGYYKADTDLTAQVFAVLSQKFILPADQFETTVDSTELAFVHTDDVNSTHIRRNVPKGALKGLQDAMAGRTAPEPYLGQSPVDRFKYVYLTEADQILNARLSADFLSELDEGRIIIPHRLQPIPHPSDMDGLNHRIKHLPPATKNVVQLNAGTDACCDAGDRTENIDELCDSFWWLCGFDTGNFSYLEKYEFMTLAEGTGIISLSSTEHSRRCIPSINGRGGC